MRFRALMSYNCIADITEIMRKPKRTEFDSDIFAFSTDRDERTIFVLFRASFCWHVYLSASMAFHGATDSAWIRHLTQLP